MIWKILEIEQTKDEEVIKAAYRGKLRMVNPEDDQEGFMELRKAYEEAILYASQEENSLHNADEEQVIFQGNKNEVDLWIDQVDKVYQDVKKRIDEEQWKTLLKDGVCENLDTELEAAEKLLVYFMSHSFMPQGIWQLVNQRFGYTENIDILKEKFPENYLEYVKWQINRPGFIDYTMFEGETDKNIDDYINKIYELKSATDEKDLTRIPQLLKEAKRFDVKHPFVNTEEAKYFLIKAEASEDETEKKGYLNQALGIMEDLEFEYSNNVYIERIYADVLVANDKIKRAQEIYQSLLEKDESNYMAKLGIANCVFLQGNPEDAKEQIEDVLEERVQDADSLALLDEVNKVLVEQYENKIKEDKTPDVCYKLGWCYYQQKRFEDGIHLLRDLDTKEEYDYVNLFCRLHLASDNYKEALPWVEKWLKLIENSEDDGSKEMKKRQNRLSLAHFSLGICCWETVFKESTGEKRQQMFHKVVEYFNQAIQEEKNILVQFSYKEQLARFYLDAEAYEECVVVCDEIIEKDRGFFPAYVHRQRAHYKLKHAKEVIDDYYACIEIYPEYAPPYVLAAEIFDIFNQYDDVEQVLDAANQVGIESDMLEFYRIRSIHYKEFSKENTEQALLQMKNLRSKVNSCGENETDVENLAEIEREYVVLYWDLDETEKALQLVDEFLEAQPNNEIMLRIQADIYMGEKRWMEAMMVCRHLLRMNPEDVRAKQMIGNCYEYKEETKNAISIYQEILETNQEYSPAVRRLMYIYSNLSDGTGGLDACKTAVEYATKFIDITDSSEGYLERGNLYIDLFELENAVEDCKKAIERDSEAYYAYNNLGCALLKLRRVEEALAPLEQALDIDPDKDHLPYLNLAECYTLQKEYDKAIEMYNEAMRIRPKAIHWKKEIAKLYALKGEYDRAIGIYMDWIKPILHDKLANGLPAKISLTQEEREKLAEYYTEIGDLQRQAGDMIQAREYFEKAYNLIASDMLWRNKYYDIGTDIAEFYRETGEFNKAYLILKNMFLFCDKNKVEGSAYRHACFVMATVCFELGKKRAARQYADKHNDSFYACYGKDILQDRRYRSARLYSLGIMYICKGDLEKAGELIGQIKDCKLCVICEKWDCFEYYFGIGLIAEITGKIEEAKQLYQRALEIKKDYPCCERHLRKISDK